MPPNQTSNLHSRATTDDGQLDAPQIKARDGALDEQKGHERQRIRQDVISSFEPGDTVGFFRTVRQVYHAPVPIPTASTVKFEYTAEDTALESVDFDLAKLIENNPGTTISYGSDFEEDMLNGIDHPFKEEIDEAERQRMLKANIARGNHKSALKPEDRHHVTKLMRSDVELGYAIPVTIDCVRNLKEAEVYPIGLQSQLTIDAEGNVIPKKRATHDLSHNRTTEESVNPLNTSDM
ncbi:hypothetical protein THAOC_22019 [Thalassiosira oceanica]|uniref:Uncharacterized protein n=1 Tax=Thalassiosira oceanica TaxID=159749 RepID=K0RVP6_THAOC|nr:hypothetical protein THAOC_22019 [Thalassiosira oceanica]|eukprot:EJK57898.1 hypothetical protein THAOC_22019 [Thalassiosira oceanica]